MTYNAGLAPDIPKVNSYSLIDKVKTSIQTIKRQLKQFNGEKSKT